jgi:hypothetical protein
MGSVRLLSSENVACEHHACKVSQGAGFVNLRAVNRQGCRILGAWTCSYPPAICRRPASSTIGTPSFSAAASLLPAFSPATR